MHDIQAEVDSRGIEVDHVGIAGVRYPVMFDDGVIKQRSIAEISVTVRLQADRRGTHMSRMVALIHEHLQVFDPRDMAQVLKTGASLLDARDISVVLSMPISEVTPAPTSGLESVSVHDVEVTGTWQDGSCRVAAAVSSEVTSLCPCSKSISDYGAHNQRSKVTLTVTGSGDHLYPLPVLEAVKIVRHSGSAPVIPLVKRVDERTLTMQAYDRPVFVEDMARDISLTCRNRGLAHEVKVRNLESIHSHDAVALITG